MKKCPAEDCGRNFESLSVLEEHVRRRHPKYLAESASTVPRERGGEEQIMQEEINKLPKIRHLKMQSKEHKPVEVYRKSQGKGKQEVKSSMDSSKMTSVVTDTRTFLESAESNERKSRRPSLNKKNSSSDLLSYKQQKLPQLKTVRQKRLQIFAGQNPKPAKPTSSSYQETDPMYTTAPNFHKILPKQPQDLPKQRPKSKQKLSPSQPAEQPLKKVNTDKLLMTKTQQGFHEKQTKSHHHRPIIKRISQREMPVEKVEEMVAPAKNIDQKEKPPFVVSSSPIEPRKTLQLKKDLKLKPTLKRESSLRKGQAKHQTTENVNYQERIVVFKQMMSSRLTIPSNAKCEFIYANNCKINSINFNNLESLREISLQHNNIKDLAFLNFTDNFNIEKIFVDHNQISFIDYLPPNIRVLSATFNHIKDLQSNSRELSGATNIQEIDFTFNPIRKQPNYRLHMISSCLTLKKIDGIKITNFDLQMASEYSRMVDEQLGLIPSNKFQNLMISKCSNSSSTVVSVENDLEDVGMSYEQLEREISKLTKVTKQTQDNLVVIKTQNQIIGQEIVQLRLREEDSVFDSEVLYEKLKGECEALQLLNFLQYASEEELEALILKKQQDMIA